MSKVDYLEILRLHALHYSKNRISASVHSSHHTVEDVIAASAAAGLSWPLEDDVTNEDIQEILFPGRYAYASPYTVPDFQYIHEELAKKGVTLTLLWEEYCQRVRSALCKASSERKEEAPQEVRKEGSHGITRGAAYYRKGGQRHE